jgi:hypothetical protein
LSITAKIGKKKSAPYRSALLYAHDFVSISRLRSFLSF